MWFPSIICNLIFSHGESCVSKIFHKYYLHMGWGRILSNYFLQAEVAVPHNWELHTSQNYPSLIAKHLEVNFSHCVFVSFCRSLSLPQSLFPHPSLYIFIHASWYITTVVKGVNISTLSKNFLLSPIFCDKSSARKNSVCLLLFQSIVKCLKVLLFSFFVHTVMSSSCFVAVKNCCAQRLSKLPKVTEQMSEIWEQIQDSELLGWHIVYHCFTQLQSGLLLPIALNKSQLF